MTTFYTSDPHWGHKRIIELCDRPFKDVDHMNSALVDNINDTCTPEDTLWILGDIIMGSFLENIEILGRLNPRLMMVAGNHDRIHAAYRCSPVKKHEAMEQYQRFFDGIARAGVDQWVLGAQDDPVVRLNHFPYDGDSHGEDRYKDLRPKDDGLPLVCGHVHGAWRQRGRQFNVGVDVNDFRPVNESVLVEWVRALEPEITVDRYIAAQDRAIQRAVEEWPT